MNTKSLFGTVAGGLILAGGIAMALILSGRPEEPLPPPPTKPVTKQQVQESGSHLRTEPSQLIPREGQRKSDKIVSQSQDTLLGKEDLPPAAEGPNPSEKISRVDTMQGRKARVMSELEWGAPTQEVKDAMAALNKQDFAAAKAIIERELAKDPASIRGNKLLAEWHWRQGDSKTAMNVMREAAEKHPDRPELWFLLAKGYANLGQVSDAKTALRSFLEVGSESPLAGSAKQFLTELEGQSGR